MPWATSQSKVREPGSMIRLCSLPISPSSGARPRSGQRALRLRDGQRLAHRDLLAAADIVLAVMAFSSAAFFTANSATGSPTTSRSMWLCTFIMRQRTAQQRHVLRRLGVLVVQLLGAEGVGGQATSGPTS
jgi:hypothetical protein